MALKNEARRLSVIRKVGKALEVSLGIEDIDVSAPRDLSRNWAEIPSARRHSPCS